MKPARGSEPAALSFNKDASEIALDLEQGQGGILRLELAAMDIQKIRLVKE